MSTDIHRMTVGGVSVQVVRKTIKNLHLGVYPPHGRVRVAAPLAVSDEAVRLAVVGKLGWIKRQRARFEAQVRQSAREMVSGESHYYLGRRYRLRWVNATTGRIQFQNQTTMILYAPLTTSMESRRQIMETWYRHQLRALLGPLIEKWADQLGVNPSKWGIRKMKTRWGGCNPHTGKIWFNLELVKKPVQCIEYLVVHELAHLLECHHDDRFTTVMNKHLPHWRHYRQELNAAPLANENWRY